MGLAGLGDLVLTCTGNLSRNRFVGEELGKGKTLSEITAGLNFPWYKEWTGVDVAETAMNKDNVKHVYNELMGKIDHDRLGAGNAPLDLGAGPYTAVAGR